MDEVRLAAVAAVLLVSQRTALAGEDALPFAKPNFHAFSQQNDSDFSDYRPVLNAEATAVLFERTFNKNPNFAQLNIADLTTNTVQRFVNIESFRPDWCWYRSNGRQLAIGPIAFSNVNGIFVFSGTALRLLPKTAGMVYPSWYPNCQYIAANVGENDQVSGEHLTAQIDATSGVVVAAPLANNSLWASFASVNQVNPRLISFAGQSKAQSNYYNELLNYTWVTNRSTNPPIVAAVDRKAPAGPGFLREFQARAG